MRTLIAITVVALMTAVPASASTAARAPSAQQRFVTYLHAVAAARQPVLAFRAQTNAAVSDMSNHNYNLNPACSQQTSATLFKKLGASNYDAIGTPAYQSGVFVARSFYVQLANICVLISGGGDNGLTAC